MRLSRAGKSSVKAMKRELREAGLFVTQKTRKGYDYYVGYDAVHFYISKYGSMLDPTRVSCEYESYDERIQREDMELNTIAHNAMRKAGLFMAEQVEQYEDIEIDEDIETDEEQSGIEIQLEALDEIIKLNSRENKLIYSLLKNCNNNIVDMTRVERKILLETGFSNRTIPDIITSLVKKGLVLRTQVRRVLFISPAYFMKGDCKKIYSLADSVKNKDKYLMEQVEQYEQRQRNIEIQNSLYKIWDLKKEEQSEAEKQFEALEKIETERQ
jgi:predicted transcriptional regulator